MKNNGDTALKAAALYGEKWKIVATNNCFKSKQSKVWAKAQIFKSFCGFAHSFLEIFSFQANLFIRIRIKEFLSVLCTGFEKLFSV